MNKLLTIAIPRYKETEQEIFPLLASISTQVGLDLNLIEVIIATDGGGDSFYSQDFLKQFNLDFKQIKLEKNLGCGPARQAAIDIASGKYVLCCDADDMLYSANSLFQLLNDAEATGAEILISDFIEEVHSQDNIYYIPKKPTTCWMHGKLLLKKFLTDNDIRFLLDLRDHEDSYYLNVAMGLAENLRYLSVPTYLWKDNPNSITRKNNHAYYYERHPEFLRASTLAFAKLEKLKPEIVSNRVVDFVHYNYFLLHQDNWNQKENLESLEETEAAFVKYMKPFIKYYYKADEEARRNSYNNERSRTPVNIESETIEQWLNRLKLTEN